jgi:hypothetical protein
MSAGMDSTATISLAPLSFPAPWSAAPCRPALRVQRRVSEDYAAWIIGLADDTVRNALITQAYHDLSHDMAASLDSGSAANWCTMAAWASRRAGQTIRGEDLPGQGLLTWVLGRLPLGRPICREVARISAEVAAGNREVFAEVAPAFATFIAAPDEAGQAALLRRFRPGPPERGGQGPLRRAFELYGEARRTRAPKRRAELVHAANLYVALQEQTRLQHRIAAAMPLGLAPFITRAMLSLELSGGLASYRMGRDLPARPCAALPRPPGDDRGPLFEAHGAARRGVDFYPKYALGPSGPEEKGGPAVLRCHMRSSPTTYYGFTTTGSPTSYSRFGIPST